MAEPYEPAARCYVLLIFTALTAVLLWICIPKFIDKTSHWDECELNNDTGVYLRVNGSKASNYDIQQEAVLDDSALSRIRKSCEWHRLTIAMYWVLVAFLIILWIGLSILIIYSSVIFGPKKPKEMKREKDQHCLALRGQYWQYKCSRFKSKFIKHPLLHELDTDNDFDNQILNYIKKYLHGAWNIRPKEYTRYEEVEKKYKMKIRHVFRIDNPKVWGKYVGDKSSLEDVVNNLSTINLANVVPTSSLASFSLREDDASLRVNCDSFADNLSRSTEQASLLERNERDQEDGAEEQHTLTSSQDIAISLSATESTANGDVGADAQGDDDISSVSSQESIPLLARSWRLSIRSVSSAPAHPEAMTENCMFLLHGTQIENAFGIIEHGLDISKARHDVFGKLISLSESSWVADKYTDSHKYPRDRHLVMFIMRTSLKHAYWRVNDEHVPPSIAKNYDGLVSGSKKGYRQFRIFKEKCCYPEFMILYDRVYPSMFGFSWEETTSL